MSMTDGHTSPEQDRLAVYEQQIQTTLDQLLAARILIDQMAAKIQAGEQILQEVRHSLPEESAVRRKLLVAETLLGMALIDLEAPGGRP